MTGEVFISASALLQNVEGSDTFEKTGSKIWQLSYSYPSTPANEKPYTAMSQRVGTIPDPKNPLLQTSDPRPMMSSSLYRAPFAPTSHISSLVQLPNEILINIFSYLPKTFDDADDDDDDDSVVEGEDARIKLRGSPILAVRQVCRLFRKIANELPFWLGDDFDISQLINSGDDFPVSEFVGALLADAHLIQRLSMKVAWRFASSEIFHVIVERIPTLPNTVSMLTFCCQSYETQFDTLAGPLSLCERLTTLHLYDVGEVDFDFIVQYLSALEILSVEYNNYVNCASWSGSLRGLSKLRHLCLVDRGGWGRREFRDMAPWTDDVDILPLESVGTLTHLRIIDRKPILLHVAHPMGNFINLTHLSLHDLYDSMVEPIANANFCLNEFEMNVVGFTENGSQNLLRRLFASPSLSGLQSLRFHHSYDNWIETMYFVATESIITNLTNLQHLTLRMRMYRSMCGQFKQSVNLKSLSWKVSRFINDLGTEDECHDQKQIAEREFENAFAHFVVRPSVAITIAGISRGRPVLLTTLLN